MIHLRRAGVSAVFAVAVALLGSANSSSTASGATTAAGTSTPTQQPADHSRPWRGGGCPENPFPPDWNTTPNAPLPRDCSALQTKVDSCLAQAKSIEVQVDAQAQIMMEKCKLAQENIHDEDARLACRAEADKLEVLVGQRDQQMAVCKQLIDQLLKCL
jgi:hypothetical protein